MGLLEDAQRLAVHNVHDPYAGGHCVFCAGRYPEHGPDCSWLAMPRIVAALEAAQRTVDAPMVMIEEHLAELAIALRGEAPNT